MCTYQSPQKRNLTCSFPDFAGWPEAWPSFCEAAGDADIVVMLLSEESKAGFLVAL